MTRERLRNAYGQFLTIRRVETFDEQKFGQKRKEQKHLVLANRGEEFSRRNAGRGRGSSHSRLASGVRDRQHRAMTPTVLDHSRTLPQGDGCARPAFTRRAVVKPERKERILTVSFILKAYLSGSRRRALWAYSYLSDRKCKRTARVSRTRARVLQIVRCSYDFANIRTVALLT